MNTIKPVPGQMMAWQDVKDWVGSMNEMELQQPAFIYTEEFDRPGGSFSTEQGIVGAETKTLGCGSVVPRLVAETAKTRKQH